MENAIKEPNKFVKFFKKHTAQFFLHITIIILMVLVLYPLFQLIIKSFKTNTQEQMNPFGFPNPFYFGNYEFAWLNIKGFFMNSIVLSIMITVGLLVVSTLAAYAFTRFEFPFKETIFISMLALMMVPGMLSIFSQYALIINLGLDNLYWGVIFPSISGSIPISVFLLRTFFRGIPKDLFEAAEIDGAGDVRKFVIIMLPLSRAIIATLTIITFIGAWNDYLWPLMVLESPELQTLPVGLVSWSAAYAENTGGWGVPFAAYVISSIPLIILFLFMSKQFIEGLTSGAFKM